MHISSDFLASGLLQRGNARRVAIFSQPQERVFQIILQYLPEGVWFASSPDIPGLNIEGDTPEEVRKEVAEWAPKLIASNTGETPGCSIRLFYAAASSLNRSHVHL